MILYPVIHIKNYRLNSKKRKKWLVGVYRRLSADEMKEEGESNSVANQKN